MVVQPESIVQLLAAGWFLYEKCKCGGKLKYKYRSENYPGYEVWWYPKHFEFRIFYQSKSVQPVTPIGKLTQVLNNMLSEATS